MVFLTNFAKIATCGVGCSILLMFGWWAIRDYMETFMDYEDNEDEDEDEDEDF